MGLLINIRLRLTFLILLLISAITGCAIYLPYQNRLSQEYTREARKIVVENGQAISVKWVPKSFPSRIETHGASSFVGSASQTKIPTGVAISNRLMEILDIMVGITDSSPNVLTIVVNKAETKFKYRMGLVQNTIRWGHCTFEATFLFNGQEWSHRYEATEEGDSQSERSPTAVLDAVWDNISLQISRDIGKQFNQIGFIK